MNTLDLLYKALLNHPAEDAAACMLVDECMTVYQWERPEAERHVEVYREEAKSLLQMQQAAALLAVGSPWRDRITEHAIQRARHGVSRNWFVLLVPGNEHPQSPYIASRQVRHTRNNDSVIITAGWVLWVKSEMEDSDARQRQDRAEEEPL